MRFHCNRCKNDFTTLSGNKDKKFAFRHFILDRMVCPHCGARNEVRTPRPLKKTRARYQPKHMSTGDLDYAPPAIELHALCRSRIIGNPLSIGGMEINCEGCPSAFNCFSGNVDDGSLNGRDYVEDNKAIKAKEKEDAIAEAKKKVAENKQREDLELLKKLRVKLGNVGFGYRFQGNTAYAQYAGTEWRLELNDKKAIVNQTWDTNISHIIKSTLIKREIRLDLAQKLLAWEIYCRNNYGA